jgi:8-oxo-dGTP diphosphatase
MRSHFKATLFSLAVVVDGDRFLLVEELDQDGRQVWFLPAGGVKAGEGFIDAAIRETREEAGIDIEIQGLLGGDQVLMEDGVTTRIRLVFLSKPVGGELKSHQDRESLRAAWFGLDEIAGLVLRHQEVMDWIQMAEQVKTRPTARFTCYTPGMLKKLTD